MEDTLTQVWQILVQIVSNLTNPEAWQEVLRRPGVYWAALIAVTLIVFAETGLLFGFFLPGDSLLVTLGIVAYGADWPIAYMMVAFTLAAICGDSLGYTIGSRAGPWLFRKEKSFFFRKDYLVMAQGFYERHGGKTIILAKFVPIIRTFAPVAAGIGKMGYRRFFPFTLVGSPTWIVSMLLLGYTMHFWLEPALNWVFAQLGLDVNFKVEKHIDKVILVIIALSVLPIAWKGWKSWRAKRQVAVAPVIEPKIPTPMA